MKLPLKSAPRTICLLRLSALGDVTHAVPVVRTLQTFWPQTHLTWIIGKTEANLVGDIAGVEFIVFDKSQGWRSYRELRHQLSGRAFDALLLMQLSLRASLASAAVRARIRLGYDRTRAKELHSLFINQTIPATPKQHVIDAFFSFIETLGQRQRKLRWDIPIPDGALNRAAAALPGMQPTLVISPCSSHSLRNWSTQRYAEVADYAINKYNFRVVLCGGPTPLEREYGDAIVHHMRHSPIDLIGKTTLKELLAVIKRADLLISPDSGPAHMATAVGTPVIGLYAATNVQRACPYLSQQWCVDRYDACAQKFLNKSASEIPWGAKLEFPGAMDLIEVQDVTAKLDALTQQI